MEKKISNAFTYMFQDKDWKYKLSILIGINIPLIFLLLTLLHFRNKNLSPNISIAFIILVLISGIILYFYRGYSCKCTHNVIFFKDKNDVLLPNWEEDFFGLFRLGFKQTRSEEFVNIIPVFVIILGATLFRTVLIPALIVFGIPLIIIYGAIFFALNRVFCSDFNSSSYVACKRAMELINSDIVNYIKIFVLLILLSIIMCILAILIGTIAYFFPATVWLATIFISIIIGYSTLVTAYLTGLIGGDINPIEPEEFSPGYEIT